MIHYLLDCLQELSSRLSDHLINFGSINKKDYWEVLSKADVVLSTAKHEFYGVAMYDNNCDRLIIVTI